MNKKMKKIMRTIKLEGPGYRAAQFDRASVDLEARTVELSFSSEEPYERYWGVEILGHDAGEVRLERLNNGGAFLMDHNTRDQIGVIEKAWIGPDRKGRALVRFGKSARAEEIFQDVIDGIRKNVSVSYQIFKMVLLKSESVDGGKVTVDTYRVTDWEPLEISLVSVPADTTVGVGRNHEGKQEVQIESFEKEEIINMKKCNICGAEFEGDSCPVCARAKEAAQKEAREAKLRVSEILAIGAKHNLLEDARKFIDEGKSVSEFKDHVIAKISSPQRDIDAGNEHPATAPDQPIYRGSKASMLGQQLMDIRTMCRPSGVSRAEVEQANSRLEQTQKRNQALLETQARKENRAAGTGGFTTGVPSDGGYFLQGETSMELMTTGFNNSEVLSRCEARTLSPGTQFLEIIGIDEQSRADGSRGGGVRVYTTKELDELTASKTKFKKIRVEPKKLTGHYVASSEMMDNVTFLGQEMRQLFGEEFAFKCQDLVIRGTGVGEPLGILNAGCKVSVAKETNQAADTIDAQNILKMEARLWREGPKVVYLVNRETKPQLATLSIAIGTAGQLVPLYKTEFYQGVRQSSLNGLPCITIEQASALGDEGDVILADLSQYITANKGDINEAMSIHVYFLYDQNAFRFIYFFDGQPRWATAVTPYKGAANAKVSPFVTIANRA